MRADSLPWRQLIALTMLVATLVATGTAHAELLEEIRFMRSEAPEAAVPEADRLHFTPPRVEQPPSLDGRLDEPVWQEPEAHLGTFRLGLSATPARHAREAWAAYDDDCLYLAVRLQREPGTELRVLTLEDDDSAVWEDDEVEVFVDPFSTGTEYFQMIVNSAGVLFDASHVIVEVPDPGGAGPGDMKLERRSDEAWSSGLRRAVLIEDEQWTVEMALPLASLGLAGAPAGHELGVNITSADWDTEEYTCLSPTSNWHDPRQFGVLRLGEPRLAVDKIDLVGVGPGRNLMRTDVRHLAGPAGRHRLSLTFEAPGQWLQRSTDFELAEGGRREIGLVFDVQAQEGAWKARIDIADATGAAVFATRRTGVLPGPMVVRLGSRATLVDGPPVAVTARLGVGRLTTRGLRLVARLVDQAGTFAAEQEIGRVEGPVLSAVMPVDELRPGLYRLEIAAIGDDGVVASSNDLLRVAGSPFEETEP